jgi:rubredoxin
MREAGSAVAVFHNAQGDEIGFALAGRATDQQRNMVKRMPELLPHEVIAAMDGNAKNIETWVCDTCGWVYDPKVGDPDGGIAPGTAWADIPDDWVCPVCGVGKDGFVRKE